MFGRSFPDRFSFARSLIASHPLPIWLRTAVVVLLSISLLDDVRQAIDDWAVIGSDTQRQLGLAGVLLSYLVYYIATWRVPAAVVAVIPVLVVSLVTGDYSGGLLTGIVLITLAPISTRWSFTVATWAIFVVWTVVASVLRGPAWPTVFWPILMLFFVAGVVGTAVRRFQVQQTVDRRRLALLQQENARIREDERAALARELHDVVAHELSIISLQITSRGGSDDPAELKGVLDSVYRSTHSALYELRLLVGLLRHDGPDDDDDLGHLNDDTSVTRVAEKLARQLTELGFMMRIEVPPEVDALPATLTRTLIRVLQESSTNIVKHAPPGCRCAGTIRLSTDHVELSVRNPLPHVPVPPDLRRGPTGWGLRGAAERLDLLGGELSAGPDGGDWVVRARIPLAADEVT